jgi:Rrf2 family protein
MRISAKADYAVRAGAELAAAPDGRPMRAEEIARHQGIPVHFLINILNELKIGGIVQSQRGVKGGYRLARPAEAITLAAIIRAVEGPLASVHESRPEEMQYPGPAEPLRDVWVAVRANLRAVLETVTLAHLAGGALPSSVRRLLKEPEVWRAH